MGRSDWLCVYEKLASKALMGRQGKEAMMRHFIKTAGMCLLLAHDSAQALSIGNIRVRSALSQRFNADIVVALNTGDNPNDIHVQLAPFDKFTERGIPWDRELLKLHFEPVQSSGSSVVIRVRSGGAITEPVLVFLLQVSSQKGTVYRQFTVLLEPPANYEPVKIRRSVEPERRAIMHYESGNGFYTPHAERKPAPARSKPVLVKPVQVVKSVKSSVTAPDVKRKPDWISVRNNDSVSKIAKRLNGGVNYEQMAIALYNANPSAFFSPNINALKAGETLRIPDRKVLNSLSSGEARTEFYRQNRAWKERLSAPLPIPQEPAKMIEAPEPVQKKLTLTAPTDIPVDQYGLLLSDDINASIKPLSSVDALTEQVQSLQERLNKMELQMDSMQKMLLVKDAQLAELQNRSATHSIMDVVHEQWTQFSNMLNIYFKLTSDSLLYLVVGFMEVLLLSLIGYYVTKKPKAPKTKADRY
jgi:pilus assembly protein FimV